MLQYFAERISGTEEFFSRTFRDHYRSRVLQSCNGVSFYSAEAEHAEKVRLSIETFFIETVFTGMDHLLNRIGGAGYISDIRYILTQHSC
ncbi:hypothetical protein D9M70_607090 [compost metagenome]